MERPTPSAPLVSRPGTSLPPARSTPPSANGHAAPVPPPRKGRRFPLFGWFGMVLLLTSFGLAYAARLQLTAFAQTTAGQADPSAASAGEIGPTKHPFALGYVDGPDGVASMYPLQPGKVEAIPVKAGEKVKKGAPLLVLDNVLAQTQVAKAEAALKIAQNQLDQARRLIPQHKIKIEVQNHIIDAKQHSADAAQAQLKDFERLVKQNLIRKEQIPQARDALAALKASVEAEKGKLRLLNLENPQQQIDEAREQVKIRADDLRDAQYALAQRTVTAPTDGEVLRILTAVGEVLGPNPRQAALLFLPAGKRIIRAELEQEFAGKVHLGQTVTIEDDSTGKGNWKGTVSHISDWFANRRSIIPEPMQLNDVRTLEITIDLEDNPNLRIGQRMRVKFD